MSLPAEDPNAAAPFPPQSGPTCEQSALSPQLRLAITFAVLFALKYAQPFVGVPPTIQVLVLLVAATFFAWRFWWRCSPNHRGALVLISVLWIAGIAKILMH
jgi:hypothetical protein